MLLIIFWHIKNLTMCIKQDACRVASSLRHLLASSYKVVEAKMIYFSNFFAHKKLRKIAHISNPHIRLMTPVRTRNLCPKMSGKVRFWTPQTAQLWGLRNRYFRTFLDMSGKSPKLRKSWDFWKIVRNRQISENRHFCGNPGKVRFLALWVLPYVSGQKPANPAKSRFWQVLAGLARTPEIVRKCKKSTFLRSQKKSKFSENFRKFWPPKKSKKSAVCRGDRRSQMAAQSENRRQKIDHFSTIFGGKGKKCPFFRLNARFCD